MRHVNIQVGDMIETPGHNQTHLYSVVGVHLGALNQESIVTLAPLDQDKPVVHRQKVYPHMPIHMLEAGIDSGLFTFTKHAENLR